MNRFIAAILLVFLATTMSSCTQPDRAIRVLEDAGYTNISVEGYAFLMCSEDDIFATSFTATGLSGNTISGAVCAGAFKGATIRLR